MIGGVWAERRTENTGESVTRETWIHLGNDADEEKPGEKSGRALRALRGKKEKPSRCPSNADSAPDKNKKHKKNHEMFD